MTAKGSEGDFEALARQYWNAWGEALRQRGEQAPAAESDSSGGEAPDWRQAVDWWAHLLPEQAAPGAQEAVARFRNQASDWLGTMQQVAARFAGHDATSEEVARAWREAVEGQGERLMQSALGAARGGDPGLRETARLFEQLYRDSAPWLDLPAFGLGRNHQTRWQTLARAQHEYQERSQAYAAQLKSAIDQAFKLFESKLAEHEGAGSQLTSARALFDLWIEAAEEAYSVVALSEEFQRVYGGLANAQVRLRAALQQEVEQLSERMGIPTRSEMDAAHRRIAELERLVRRMAAGAAGTADKGRAGNDKASPAAAGAREAAGQGRAAKKAAAKKRQDAAAPRQNRPKSADVQGRGP
ncbi:MAG: class III poly(R)-hydroxyalkanoic acid synthase subunit PhaE [Pseudomonas sp.]